MVSFDKYKIDLGIVKPSEKKTVVFRYQQDRTNPVLEATASCRCMKVKHDKHEHEIIATFTTKEIKENCIHKELPVEYGIVLNTRKDRIRLAVKMIVKK